MSSERLWRMGPSVAALTTQSIVRMAASQVMVSVVVTRNNSESTRRPAARASSVPRARPGRASRSIEW